MANESTQWRKFLQPVVTGLVALMSAGVGYLAQYVVTYCKRWKTLERQFWES